MDTFKEEFFPDYNKKKTHLSINQWFLRNTLLLPLKIAWVSILGVITVLSILAVILILIITIVYFVLGFYFIINDFFNHYNILKTGGNCICFIVVTLGLITCLLPSSNVLYLTYLMFW
jgi:hypothetical protein